MQLNLLSKTTCLEGPHFYDQWSSLSREVLLYCGISVELKMCGAHCSSVMEHCNGSMPGLSLILHIPINHILYFEILQYLLLKY